MKNIILHKKLKSTRKSIDDLIKIIYLLRYNITISEKDFYNVYLCIYELYINALCHGNKYNPTKYIEIIIECEDNMLKITIIDQGDGFILDNVPNPLAEKNLLEVTGRGIFIINNYAKSIEYKHNFRGFNVVVIYELEENN